jgi:hypothetical protein
VAKCGFGFFDFKSVEEFYNNYLLRESNHLLPKLIFSQTKDDIKENCWTGEQADL